MSALYLAFDLLAEARRELGCGRPDLGDYPNGLTLTDRAETDYGSIRNVLSPIGEVEGRRFFLDLDLGRAPGWPAAFPKDDSTAGNIASVREWASEKGVDLMCVARPNDQGGVTFVLSGVDLQVWEIDKFDAQNIDTFLAKQTLPERRKVERGFPTSSRQDLEETRPSSRFVLPLSDAG
jgi:hypothetical protein